MSNLKPSAEYIREAMSDKEIQTILFKLAEIQQKHPKVTPKIKKMINDLQKEMLKAEIAKQQQ